MPHDPLGLSMAADQLIVLAPRIAAGLLAFVGVMAVFIRMAWR